MLFGRWLTLVVYALEEWVERVLFVWDVSGSMPDRSGIKGVKGLYDFVGFRMIVQRPRFSTFKSHDIKLRTTLQRTANTIHYRTGSWSVFQ